MAGLGIVVSLAGISIQLLALILLLGNPTAMAGGSAQMGILGLIVVLVGGALEALGIGAKKT